MIWRRWRPGGVASRGRPFGLVTVHSKLLAAFAIVIFVALGTVAGGTLSLVQRYQTQQAVDHLTDILVVTAAQVRWLTLAGAPPQEIATVVTAQAEQFGVRVLLLDAQNRTLEDVAPDQSVTLQGTILTPPDSPRARVALRRRLLSPQIVAWRAELQPLHGSHVFIAARLTAPRREPPLGRLRSVLGTPTSVQRVVLVVPEASLGMAWLELAPSLAIAALIALGVSAGAALWLSRSIARPLRQITIASEAMAQGNYQQSIPVRGGDEVAQLARAFNAMAREVDRANRALRAFLADASHELRTPLTGVQGWAQALMEGEVQGAEGSAEAGRIIYNDAERMNRLVESLLYLSKITSGQLPLERKPVDLGELLRVTVARLQPRATEVGQQVALPTDGHPAPSVYGDVRLLERLFGNVVENAVKYAPQGATIRVTTGTGQPPELATMRHAPHVSTNGAASAATLLPGADGNHVTEREQSPRANSDTVWVTVHNTDSVIPPDDLPHLFERFYRVEKSRAQHVDGTGLGLAIAQEIVFAHDGAITVASSPEHGTGFTIRLPASAGHAAGKAAQPLYAGTVTN